MLEALRTPSSALQLCLQRDRLSDKGHEAHFQAFLLIATQAALFHDRHHAVEIFDLLSQLVNPPGQLGIRNEIAFDQFGESFGQSLIDHQVVFVFFIAGFNFDVDVAVGMNRDSHVRSSLGRLSLVIIFNIDVGHVVKDAV